MKTILFTILSIAAFLSMPNLFGMHQPSKELSAEQQQRLEARMKEAVETPMFGTEGRVIPEQRTKRLSGFPPRTIESYVQPTTPPTSPRTTGTPGNIVLQESYYGQQGK